MKDWLQKKNKIKLDIKNGDKSDQIFLIFLHNLVNTKVDRPLAIKHRKQLILSRHLLNSFWSLLCVNLLGGTLV
jgi:hypothetical protein